MTGKGLLQFLALAAVAMLCGCGGGTTSKVVKGGGEGPLVQTPFPMSIEVTPSAPNLRAAGATQQFTAFQVSSDGTSSDVTTSATWKTLSSTVASVTSGGKVTAAGNGMTEVTATVGSITGYAMVVVGSQASSAPATFFVATTGSDSNNGTTIATAFATLNKARQAVAGRPGSIVEIEPGTYFLSSAVSFTGSDSGAPGNPIIYRAGAGGPVVISGGKQIPGTSWTNTSGNTWTASLSSAQYSNFEGLFYNGERRYRPRSTSSSDVCTTYPCSSYLYLPGTNPVTSGSMSTNCSLQQSDGTWDCFDQFFYNPNDLNAAGYHGMGTGDVEVLDFNNWTMERMRLASLDTTNNIAHLTGPTYQQNTSGFMAGHRYLIENVLENFNQPGQWYLDRCPGCANTVTTPATTWNLSYIAQTGENPSTDTVIVPQQSQLIVGNGVSNIVFQGLTFSHDNWLPSATGFGDQQASPYVTAAVSFTASQDIVFTGCTFAHTQGWGLEIVGNQVTPPSGNMVLSNAFYDIGAGAVRIGMLPCKGAGQELTTCVGADSDSNVPQYNLVQNNWIAAGGRVQPTGIGTGVWIGNSHHNVVTNNDISDFYSGAIGIGGTYGLMHGMGFAHDNVISFNHLYMLGQGVTSDMGGVYFATSAASGNPSSTAGVPASGNIVLNNVIHDVTHDYMDTNQSPPGYGGNGIYYDQGATTVLSNNNLVYRVSGYAAFNNLSDHDKDTFPQDNVFLNNIFALSLTAIIRRGGENPYSFAFVRNIAYWDMGTLQNNFWTCADVGNTGQSVPCNQRFFFDYNDYWPTGAATLQFVTTAANSTNAMNLNFSQWQGLGEDVHSINQNPDFTNPNATSAPPSNGFTLQSTSPALAAPITFNNFDSAQAGIAPSLTAPPAPPTVACPSGSYIGACPAFPLQVLTPAQY
jgi:hypothetical protein